MDGQVALQDSQRIALLAVEFCVMDLQMVKGLVQCLEVTRVQLQMSNHQLQAIAFCCLFCRQALEQTGNLAEVSLGEQIIGAGFDDIGSCLDVAGPHRMTHRFIEVIVLAEPHAGDGVQHLFLLRPGRQPRTQYAAQQRVQAIPGLAVVALDLGNEQVVAIEPRQLGHHAGDGVRLADQRRA
ncbi:hypothetical protein D3C76_1185530 [compost metagenome]